MARRGDRTALRYLDATNVQHPAGTLAGLAVCGRNDENLGSLGGVLVEPRCRRVRYLVVERSALLSRKRYLVPVDCLATLQREAGTIYIDADRGVVERFDDSSVPVFSDDDLVDAMFAPTAA